MIGTISDFAANAAAVATITVTITRAKIARPLRAWVGSKGPQWKELIGCPYCFSHWVSLIVGLLFTQEVFVGLFYAAALVAAAMGWAGLIGWGLEQLGPGERSHDGE